MTNPEEKDVLAVDPSFLEENKSLKLGTTSQKSGGPYSKGQRRKRRTEVYRLHFEQGVPAIKIADMMQVNRNTVNDDIRWLYTKMTNDIQGQEFNGYLDKQLVRLEAQRTRLASYLAEAKDLNVKLTVERQLTDLDFRLASMIERFKMNGFRFWEEVIKQVNKIAEDNLLDYRFTNVFELYKISIDSRKSLGKLREETGRKHD